MSQTRITELTPEQQALIPIIRDEWIKIALGTSPSKIRNPCRASNGGLPPTEMEETSGYSKEAEKLAILEVS